MWAPAFAAVAAAAAPAPEPSEDNSKCQALGRRGKSQHMVFLASGAQSYRTCQLQQRPRHLCAVRVDAVGFLLVDHGGGCCGRVCTLLTELLQCIWSLAGQRLQELLHAMLRYAASLLPHELLIRACAIQGVVHC